MKNQLWHWFYHQVSHFYHKLHFQEVYVSRPKDDFWLKPHLREKQKISAQFFSMQFTCLKIHDLATTIYPPKKTGRSKNNKVDDDFNIVVIVSFNLGRLDNFSGPESPFKHLQVSFYTVLKKWKNSTSIYLLLLHSTCIYILNTHYIQIQ